MFNFEKLLLILLTLSVFSFTAKSQTPDDIFREQERRQRELEKKREDTDLLEKKRQLDNVKPDSPKVPITEKQKALIKKILAPNAEDLSKYKSFLKESDTGIFRLFPDLGRYSKATVCTDGNCSDIFINTWSYSFRQKDYTDDIILDIRLNNETLISDGLLSQGILVDLGNVALEDVSLSIKGLKFLVDFKPETEISKVKNQYLQIAKGIKFDDYNYTNSVKAAVNTTYAARLIAYGFDVGKLNDFAAQNSADSIKYQSLKRDKRDDLIVAFRIIRIEDNGKITILWKRLKRQAAAKINL